MALEVRIMIPLEEGGDRRRRERGFPGGLRMLFPDKGAGSMGIVTL